MAYFQSSLYNSNTALQFEVTPDIGQVTGKQYKNDVKESLGGVEYVSQAHTGKRTWEFSWSNISSTFKGNLEGFRNAVGGSFNSFTYNDGSSSYTVRMSQDSLQFTESLFERFSTSIKLREVSPS